MTLDIYYTPCQFCGQVVSRSRGYRKVTCFDCKVKNIALKRQGKGVILQTYDHEQQTSGTPDAQSTPDGPVELGL